MQLFLHKGNQTNTKRHCSSSTDELDVDHMEDREESRNLVTTCAPHPNPVETIADGGDHDPSDFRATTRPVPSLYVRNAPAFITVKIASPLAPLRTACGIDLSGFSLATCIK
jgi:hypothetical protein